MTALFGLWLRGWRADRKAFAHSWLSSLWTMKEKVRKQSKTHPPIGFTLTEILVVVAIVAILAGVGGGVYTGTYRKLLVEKAARAFVLTARYAKIKAIEQQQKYRIYIDPVNGAFYLGTVEFDEQTGQTQQTIVSDYYCRPVEMEGGVTFEDVQISPLGVEDTAYARDQEEEGFTIVFNPDGTAQATVVQIGDGKTHYTIGISPATGKAGIQFGTSEDVTLGVVDLDAQ